jgi:transposase-like protein
MPRPYPPEFRRRALDLLESGRTVRDVAASLGIAESCLHRWRHRDLVDRGLKPGATARESTELAAARERIRDLEEEVKILRKAAAAVEAVVRPKDRYRLVAELHAEGVRVRRACHALGVSRSGFYAWAARAPSPRAIRQAWLTDLIGTIHQASRGTYGAPRVHAELVYGHGITVGHNTVSLLMRRAGLAGLPTRSRGKQTKKLATVTDLVRRDFRRTGPNQLWVTDITGHPTREGKVYCCVVIDAWSRRVAGWAIDSRQRLPQYTCVKPERPDALTAAITAAKDARPSVLWLDDLERYLRLGGLTQADLADLPRDGAGGVIVLATMRAGERQDFSSRDDPDRGAFRARAGPHRVGCSTGGGSGNRAAVGVVAERAGVRREARG